MSKPDIAITVESGAIMEVASKGKPLLYRIIDLDEMQYGDYESESNYQNINNLTSEKLGEDIDFGKD